MEWTGPETAPDRRSEEPGASVVPLNAWAPLQTLVLDAVPSPHSKAAYAAALDDFFAWCEGNGRPRFTKAAVLSWVASLQTRGLSPSTINLRLSAVRKLAAEAADNGLLDPVLAQGIARAKGLKQAGTRTGNWLTKSQAEDLLALPNPAKLIGLRDRALLAVMIGCGLRRSEVSALQFAHIQQREGRWVLVDLVGKGHRRRSVPMPAWAKAAIDTWTSAAGLGEGHIFRSMNNKGQLAQTVLLPQNILELVSRYGRRLGFPALAPHDLRRTFAKLAHKGGAALEQLQLSLGHASIQTTERYLGVRQDLSDAPCDRLGLRVGGD